MGPVYKRYRETIISTNDWFGTLTMQSKVIHLKWMLKGWFIVIFSTKFKPQEHVANIQLFNWKKYFDAYSTLWHCSNFNVAG